MKELTQILKVAQVFGINSPLQLEVFITCATNEGKNLTELLGYPSTEPTVEARNFNSAVRQLMIGAKCRGYNGVNLLTWGSSRPSASNGKGREVILTERGKSLFREIQRLNRHSGCS